MADLSTTVSNSGLPPIKEPLYCSFCGKSQHEVKKLVAGPGVWICDECVDLCQDIIHKSEPQLVPEGPVLNEGQMMTAQVLVGPIGEIYANERGEPEVRLKDGSPQALLTQPILQALAAVRALAR